MVLALAAPAAAPTSAEVQEVPGAPVELTVPHQKGAADLSEDATGTATPTPTPTADGEATPTPTADSGTTGSTGHRPAPTPARRPHRRPPRRTRRRRTPRRPRARRRRSSSSSARRTPEPAERRAVKPGAAGGRCSLEALPCRPLPSDRRSTPCTASPAPCSPPVRPRRSRAPSWSSCATRLGLGQVHLTEVSQGGDVGHATVAANGDSAELAATCRCSTSGPPASRWSSPPARR